MKKILFCVGGCVAAILLFSVGFLSGSRYAIRATWFMRDPDGVETPVCVQRLVSDLAALREGDVKTVRDDLELQLTNQALVLAQSPFAWPEKGQKSRERALGLTKVYFERYPLSDATSRNTLAPLLKDFATPECTTGTCWPATRRLIDPKWTEREQATAPAKIQK